MQQIKVITKTVGEIFGVKPERILASRDRHEPLATARIVAMALCAEAGTMKRSDVARQFRRHPSQVTHASLMLRDRYTLDRRFRQRGDRAGNQQTLRRQHHPGRGRGHRPRAG